MDMYQKREMRKNKKLDENTKSLPSASINWYPGHMAKTKREISEKLDLIDIVYEVIDARMPRSSKIVDLDNLLKNKPRILIVTKYDLCDQNETNKFLNEYRKDYLVITVDLKKNDNLFNKKLIELTKKLLNDINIKRHEKGLSSRTFRALVVGVPNVGKSTLINRLAGRNVVKTANVAGVTKSLSWIRLNKDIELLDTPGILWPKIEQEEVGYNLASLSSIKEEILDMESVSSYIIKFLYKNYPLILKNKYGIEKINPEDLTEVFDIIGKKRGALLKGGIVDYDKVYNLIINDLKEGKIGQVTFDIFN